MAEDSSLTSISLINDSLGSLTEAPVAHEQSELDITADAEMNEGDGGDDSMEVEPTVAHEGSGAADTSQISDETLNTGDKTGDETLNTGDETLITGDETLNTGDETLEAGDETLNTGEETLSTGDTGDETRNTGDETQATIISDAIPTQAAQPVKRKRGRPPKSATPITKLTTPIEKISTPIEKKKRGRPPKSSDLGPAAKKTPRTVPSKKRSSGGSELFDIILEGKSALQSIVGEWVERYHADQEKGTLELVQFFVRCSGCLAGITLDNYRNKEAVDIIQELTKNFDEDSGDYPLAMSGLQYRKFKSNYAEFVERLVTDVGEAILFDEYMFDSIVMWLMGLSDSQVRAFRHTSTLACLKLVTGLVQMAVAAVTEADNAQRQLDAEAKRTKRTAGKLEKLAKKVEDIKSKQNAINDMMNTLFTSVFVRRFRDTRPEIRALCMSELGVWMMEFSSHFLADHYLKYIGWSLYDKVGEVRLQSLLSLQPLYESPDLTPHLELFTEKFKERLVSMRLDREENVAMAAVNLCCHLLSLDMLEAEECVEVCELVFLDTKVAQAAGAFATKYLFSDDFMAKARRVKPPQGHKKPNDAIIMMREIVRFFTEARIHEYATFFVDSLWDHAPVLQDWVTYITILNDATCGIVLDNSEEKAIIEILRRAVQRATGVSITSKTKKILSVKDRKNLETTKEKLATVLIPVLPDLIAKYGTDPDCASNLVAIPQYFDLSMIMQYVQLRTQKHLDDLLSQLQDLFQKQSNTEVLTEIAATYNSLLNPEFTLKSTVQVSFASLVDSLVEDCRNKLKAVDGQSLAEEDDDIYNLGVALKRVSCLSRQIDMTKWSLEEEMLKIVEEAIEGEASDMLVIPVMSSLLLHLSWSMSNLDSTQPDRAALRSIHALSGRLLQIYHDLLKLGSPDVQHEAFTILCDLLMLLGQGLKNQGLGALVRNPDDRLQAAMLQYVMENVFGDDEEELDATTDEEALAQAERLNNRRILLSGYVRLIIYSIIDMAHAAPVFAQYLKFNSSYGDIIKYTVTKSREISHKKWYRTILSCLETQYTMLQEESSREIDHTSTDWADLKDLAKRLGQTTSFDPIKCREPIVAIHCDGINFALHHDGPDEDPETPPPNLDFLDIIGEFGPRLLPVDCSVVLTHLKEQIKEEIYDDIFKADSWKKLRNYVAGIEAQEETGSKTAGAGKTAPTKKKAQVKSTKRKLSDGGGSRASKTAKVAPEQ